MNGLADFLLARIAEDEDTARECRGRAEWVESGDRCVVTVHGIRIADTHALATEHIASWDPARVLAECAAKRRIVELAAAVVSIICGEWNATEEETEGWQILSALALPYAGHADYLPEWKP